MVWLIKTERKTSSRNKFQAFTKNFNFAIFTEWRTQLQPHEVDLNKVSVESAVALSEDEGGAAEVVVSLKMLITHYS